MILIIQRDLIQRMMMNLIKSCLDAAATRMKMPRWSKMICKQRRMHSNLRASWRNTSKTACACPWMPSRHSMQRQWPKNTRTSKEAILICRGLALTIECANGPKSIWSNAAWTNHMVQSVVLDRRPVARIQQRHQSRTLLRYFTICMSESTTIHTHMYKYIYKCIHPSHKRTHEKWSSLLSCVSSSTAPCLWHTVLAHVLMFSSCVNTTGCNVHERYEHAVLNRYGRRAFFDIDALLAQWTTAVHVGVCFLG